MNCVPGSSGRYLLSIFGRVGEVVGVEVRVDRGPRLALVGLHDLLAAAGAERERQRDRGQRRQRSRPACDSHATAHWLCVRRLHPREQPLVLLAELLLVLRADRRARPARSPASRTRGRRWRSCTSSRCSSVSAARSKLAPGGRSGRAGRDAGPDDRLEALLEVAVDLVGLLVAVALLLHARGPLLGRPSPCAGPG